MEFHFLKNRAFRILFLIIIAAGVLGAGGYYYITKTPEYSLKSAGSAIKEKDWEKFSKYVDTRSVLDKGADALIEEYITRQKLDANQSGFARSAVGFLKKQLIGIAENQLRLSLFEENDTDNSSPTASTASSTKNPKKSDPKKLKLDRMESKYLGNDSTLVTVYLKSSDINDKEERILKIKMIDRGNHWQAVEITNLPEVLKWPEAFDILGK